MVPADGAPYRVVIEPEYPHRYFRLRVGRIGRRAEDRGRRAWTVDRSLQRQRRAIAQPRPTAGQRPGLAITKYLCGLKGHHSASLSPRRRTRPTKSATSELSFHVVAPCVCRRQPRKTRKCTERAGLRHRLRCHAVGTVFRAPSNCSVCSFSVCSVISVVAFRVYERH
jgi:hypothetical protein